jgi:hypothetical protein
MLLYAIFYYSKYITQKTLKFYTFWKIMHVSLRAHIYWLVSTSTDTEEPFLHSDHS